MIGRRRRRRAGMSGRMRCIWVTLSTSIFSTVHSFSVHSLTHILHSLPAEPGLRHEWSEWGLRGWWWHEDDGTKEASNWHRNHFPVYTSRASPTMEREIWETETGRYARYSICTASFLIRFPFTFAHFKIQIDNKWKKPSSWCSTRHLFHYPLRSLSIWMTSRETSS